MALIDLSVAREHVRLDADITDQDAALQLYLDAAEESAMAFLNRRVYADQQDYDTARADLPNQWSTAEVEFQAAVAAAQTIESWSVREQALCAAESARQRARQSSSAVMWGILMNPAIQAGILLTFGHLFLNREDVVTGTSVAQLPIGAQQILMPYRAQMGV